MTEIQALRDTIIAGYSYAEKKYIVENIYPMLTAHLAAYVDQARNAKYLPFKESERKRSNSAVMFQRR